VPVQRLESLGVILAIKIFSNNFDFITTKTAFKNFVDIFETLRFVLRPFPIGNEATLKLCVQFKTKTVFNVEKWM